ncbi:MAG: sugar phosphate isomerase/epimerase family protein [Halanaerobiales bacterium]
MKLGVSSYSFKRLVDSGELTQMEMIEKAADMGFDGIEFSGIEVPEDKNAETVAEEVRDKCEKTGIEPINYTIAADFINSEGVEAEVERLYQEVEIARILGVSGMRHDATTGFPPDYDKPRGFEDALPLLVKGCKGVTEYAAKYDIKTMVENHGFFCQDSDRVEKLVNGVNHSNFGVLIDIGNFLCVDEAPGQAVGRLMPYVSHIHIKDFHIKPGTAVNPGTGWFQSRGGNYLRGAIIGHGNVPVMQCLKLIKKHNYNSYLSIEFEGMEAPLTGVKVGLENLKKMLSKIE